MSGGYCGAREDGTQAERRGEGSRHLEQQQQQWLRLAHAARARTSLQNNTSEHPELVAELVPQQFGTNSHRVDYILSLARSFAHARARAFTRPRRTRRHIGVARYITVYTNNNFRLDPASRTLDLSAAAAKHLHRSNIVAR